MLLKDLLLPVEMIAVAEMVDVTTEAEAETAFADKT